MGSFPTARLIAKSHGIDITKVGSGNAGGTNVGRSVGKKAGILTIALDAFKCFLACMLTFVFISYVPMNLVTFPHMAETFVAISAITCSIGHSFPLFGKYPGGKCVACFGGYVLFIAPIVALIGLMVFLITFFISKRVSIASLVGAPVTLIVALVPMVLDFTIVKDDTLFNGGMYYAPSFMLHITYVSALALLALVILIYIRHKANIKRIQKNEEPETHFKKD